MFYLFSGYYGFSGGGFNDYQKAFNTLEEAKDIKKFEKDWYQIVTVNDGELVLLCKWNNNTKEWN